MVRIPTIDPIDFLVRRKFPDATQIDAACSRFSLGRPLDVADLPEQLRRLWAPIHKYYEELKVMPEEELSALYELEYQRQKEELRLKAEQEERARFFHHPEAEADISHWSKASYWTLEEAIALSYGKEPSIVNWDKLKKTASHIYPPSPFIIQYEKTRDLVLRAKAWKQLYDPSYPGPYIAWARRNEIPFPQELEELVKARGGNIADWQTAYETQKKNHEKLVSTINEGYESLLAKVRKDFQDYSANAIAILKEKNELIAILKEESEALQARLAELEKVPVSAMEPSLKTIERNTLLKLVIGMAVAGYRYDPQASRNSAVADIASDLERLEIAISDDTIRKWLGEAAQFLNQKSPETLA